MKYRVIELFSGVGSQRMALKRLSEKRPDLEFEFVAQCDIDKYAIKSYRECWRLMGMSDEDYDKAAEVCSESQLYKQAGNSIVVDVLEALFDTMLTDTKTIQQKTLGDW